MAALSKPREAALKALVACDKDGAYLNIALRDILSAGDMDARDNALATVIAFGVVKNRLFIDNIIENLSTVKLKKLSVWIHNILRIGVYCIKFLDRIPISATVNECVRLSRRYGHRASAGYVNALLRAAGNSGDFLPENCESAEYISMKYSMPLWLVQMWRPQGYGGELFSAMNEEPPVTVRLNSIKCSSLPDEFKKIDGCDFGYNYEGVGSVEHTSLFKDGCIAVQDLASQKAIEALGVRGNSRVLDLCSAPGGKAAYISQIMNNTGEVVCCDIHSHKLELIKNNLSRMGVTNACVTLNDAMQMREDFINAFDTVVADVPCSGLGVLRRKPDIKWTKSTVGNEELTKIQRKIFDNAAQYVKCGGRLMYSTCTINKAENEDNVDAFLKEHPDFILIEKRQLLPNTDLTDGFFYAVLERK